MIEANDVDRIVGEMLADWVGRGADDEPDGAHRAIAEWMQQRDISSGVEMLIADRTTAMIFNLAQEARAGGEGIAKGLMAMSLMFFAIGFETHKQYGGGD